MCGAPWYPYSTCANTWLRRASQRLSDSLVLVHSSRRLLALMVDAVEGVQNGPCGAIVPPELVFPGLASVRGVLKQDDGLVLIQNLAGFLSLDEEAALDAALIE